MNLNFNFKIVYPEWEIIQANPDIQKLFLDLNLKIFDGQLENVKIKWSPRMYKCAGRAFFMPETIKISEPLVKSRILKEVVEVLLHEMLHLYLYKLNIKEESHGPMFVKYMNEINEKTGTNIAVFHSFNVSILRIHWWLCNGKCREFREYRKLNSLFCVFINLKQFYFRFWL